MRLRISRIAALALSLLTLFSPSGVLAAGRGSPLAAVAAINLDGKPVQLDELTSKPSVINVWATWCPPCRNEMSSLQQLATRLAHDGIAVVALSVDTDHNLVREFVLKYGISFPTPIAVAPREAMSALNVPALPITLYVDGNGRIVGRYVGERNWADEAAVQEVRRTLQPPRKTSQ